MMRIVNDIYRLFILYLAHSAGRIEYWTREGGKFHCQNGMLGPNIEMRCRL